MKSLHEHLGIRPAIDVHVQSQAMLRRGILPGMRVLDVGCGDGALVDALNGIGATAVGLEIDPALVAAAVRLGLDVVPGRAEALPFVDASFDAIVCCVVIPYTDQRLAVREWARVLRPGGLVNATYHGPGYGIHYLLAPPQGYKSRFYGARMLVNTAMYAVTGRRIPGFLGDTLCQTDTAMRGAAEACGLRVETSQVLDRTLGVARIIFHGLRKVTSPSVSSV